MERSSGGGQLPYPYNRMHMTTAAAAAVEHQGKITSSKPPKFKAISRSISMAIDNYDDVIAAGSGDSSTLIVEKPLIHRAASPVPISSFPPSQSLAPPASLLMHHSGVRASSADIIVSPALSARQRSYELYKQHSQTSTRTVSPVLSGSISGRQQQQQQQQQPELYVIGSGSLGDNFKENLRNIGGRSPPIDFIDDYPLPAMHIHHTATHPFKKSMLRRSDTIDVQSTSNIQMKKTQSFHMAAGTHDAAADPLLLNTAKEQAANGITSNQRTSSLHSNFLMPGPTAATKQLSRSPSPSRRGHRSHRSIHDPIKRPDSKLNSVIDSQIRHPSLNDDLIDTTEVTLGLLPKAHVSLENDIFIDPHSYAKSHTKLNEVDVLNIPLHNLQEVRKASSSFEETCGSTSTSSLKKRETKSARQHSTQSLELNGRPSPTAETATAIATVPARSTLHLHSVAAATSAVHHFKRGKKHGRSLYLSPANLDELTTQHRPVLLAAAANFQSDNAKSLKQARALYSASVRLKTYREALSASKKSRSFLADDIFPTSAGSNATNEFIELSSPHRFNTGVLNTKTIDDVTSSPRLTSSTSPIDFLNEKRPSFETKPPLAYDTADTAFEQVLRPFHHKITGMQTSAPAPSKVLHHPPLINDDEDNERNSERKRKRIVCIVMIVFLCLMSASVFVVIMTLTHSSGQSHAHHHSTTFKKTYSYNRDVPVHYNGNHLYLYL